MKPTHKKIEEANNLEALSIRLINRTKSLKAQLENIYLKLDKLEGINRMENLKLYEAIKSLELWQNSCLVDYLYLVLKNEI